MTTTDEILRRIEKGGTLDELAKELDMRKSILVARIEFLVRAGYLCEIRAGNGCAECTMCKTCSVPVPGGGKDWVKMYVLTDKGRESIAGLKK
jgi:DNA-binding MarR family transcriptional regulator